MSAGHVGVTQEWVSANRANADIDSWYIEFFFLSLKMPLCIFFFLRGCLTHSDSCLLTPA